jgi:hypothetical protein
MKKQLFLALIFTPLFISACEETTLYPELESTPIKPISITSILPTSGLGGSEVAIMGENFGEAIADNYVTLSNGIPDQSGWAAEVIQVPHSGMIAVRIPQFISPGEYIIEVHSKGQSCDTLQKFTVLDPIIKY